MTIIPWKQDRHLPQSAHLDFLSPVFIISRRKGPPGPGRTVTAEPLGRHPFIDFPLPAVLRYQSAGNARGRAGAGAGFGPGEAAPAPGPPRSTARPARPRQGPLTSRCGWARIMSPVGRARSTRAPLTSSGISASAGPEPGGGSALPPQAGPGRAGRWESAATGGPARR